MARTTISYTKARIGNKKHLLLRNDSNTTALHTVLTFEQESELRAVMELIDNGGAEGYVKVKDGNSFWLFRHALGGQGSLYGVAKASSEDELDAVLSRMNVSAKAA